LALLLCDTVTLRAVGVGLTYDGDVAVSLLGSGTQHAVQDLVEPVLVVQLAVVVAVGALEYSEVVVAGGALVPEERVCSDGQVGACREGEFRESAGKKRGAQSSGHIFVLQCSTALLLSLHLPLPLPLSMFRSLSLSLPLALYTLPLSHRSGTLPSLQAPALL